MTPEEIVKHWNDNHPPGTPVTAFGHLTKDGEGRNPFHTKTRSEARLLGRYPVVAIEGRSGAHALTHIQLREA